MQRELDPLLSTQVQQQKRVTYVPVDQELNFLTNNAALIRWTGLEIESLVGKSVLEVFPELIGAEEAVWQLSHDSGQSFALTKLHRLTADGLDYYFDLQIEPASHLEHGYILIIVDVTQQAHLEQVLEQQQNSASLVEELQHQTADLQARNEELDAFAHTVAHDLQNPLAMMVGFADLLLEDDGSMPEAERNEILKTFSTNAYKISNIVQELLLLSSVRKTEVQLQPLDMQEIVDAALKRLTYLFDKYNQAKIEQPITWPAALGYAPWIEEVWENYISNALKYGGDPPYIELGGETLPDGTVRFWVRDNGDGLTSEAQSSLFVPFTKLNKVRATGHGLGLSIVRRIMNKLGGQTRVESEVGQGSVFSFILPGVEDE